HVHSQSPVLDCCPAAGFCPTARFLDAAEFDSGIGGPPDARQVAPASGSRACPRTLAARGASAAYPRPRGRRRRAPAPRKKIGQSWFGTFLDRKPKKSSCTRFICFLSGPATSM